MKTLNGSDEERAGQARTGAHPAAASAAVADHHPGPRPVYRLRPRRGLPVSLLLGIALAVFPALPGLSSRSELGAQETGTARVLATTPWTAAFAEAAGAPQIDLLAPYEMRHPPEYELRATDLRRVETADLVVYAGYETMMDRLEQSLGSGSVRSVQIHTAHTREAIESAVLAIAAALGTEEQARRNLAEIHRFLNEWSQELQAAGLAAKPVLVHGFQVPLLEDLGIPVAGRFGPAPLEAQQIVRLSRTGAHIVIDNWHNEVAQPLAETLPDATIATFINFPGHDGTRTLLDVLRFNRQALARAIRYR